MNFTKTILNGLKVWINSNFISHNKQDLTNEQQKQAQENIGLIEETSDDAMDLLAEMSVIEFIADEDGSILTDENSNILTI